MAKRRQRPAPKTPKQRSAPRTPIHNPEIDPERHRKRRAELWLTSPWILLSSCFMISLHPTFFGVGCLLGILMTVVLLSIRYSWVMGGPFPLGQKQRFRLRARVAPWPRFWALLGGTIVWNGGLAIMLAAGAKLDVLAFPLFLGLVFALIMLRQAWIVLGGGPTTVEISDRSLIHTSANVTVLYSSTRPLRKASLSLMGYRRHGRRKGSGISVLHHETLVTYTPSNPLEQRRGAIECTIPPLPQGTGATRWRLRVELHRMTMPNEELEFEINL